MEENAYIVSIAASVFYLVVSVRFFRLHGRSRERPELLLALYFALSGIYYLGYNLPSALRLDSWPALAELAVEWAYVIGVFPFLLFIRSVFRPSAAWAGWLAGACSVCLLAGTVMATHGGTVVYSLESQWFLVQWVGYSAPCLWLALEALLYRRGAMKRARIGLCSPVVANRYLLIGLFSIFQILACLSDLSVANDLDGNQTISLITDVLVGSSEIASIAALWLAFFPPPLYANWIVQRTRVLPTPMDG